MLSYQGNVGVERIDTPLLSERSIRGGKGKKSNKQEYSQRKLYILQVVTENHLKLSRRKIPTRLAKVGTTGCSIKPEWPLDRQNTGYEKTKIKRGPISQIVP